MAKDAKKPVTVEAVGLLRTPEGYELVTVLADEEQIVERSKPDTLFVQKFELKKAWVKLIAKAQEGR